MMMLDNRSSKILFSKLDFGVETANDCLDFDAALLNLKEFGTLEK